MATIQIPESAETFLNYCKPWASARDDACFSNYAEMVLFAASLGYKISNGQRRKPPINFLKQPNPIDLMVFKNQGLFPAMLLICLATTKSHAIARQEERIVELIESFADAGFKELSEILRESTPADFIFSLARLVVTTSKLTSEP
jgi:dnd system-associated protein 4